MTKKKTNKRNTIIKCSTCLKPIPKSAACSFEGEEYVWFFCGSLCYEQWCLQIKKWLSEEEPANDFVQKSRNIKQSSKHK